MSARQMLLLAGFGLWMAGPLLGMEPSRLGVEGGRALNPPQPMPTNQQIANTIAEHLRQSAQLRRFDIDVTYLDGTAELTGVVADQIQREEARRIVQGVPGVERVRDRLTLASAGQVRQVQATQEPPPLPGLGGKDAPAKEPSPLSPKATEGAANAAAPNEPLPIFAAPRPSAYDLNPPKLPPYAWPTYAPYNNYSRVATPTLYPYNAWPFIGPCYPYPKIPLGWRSVKLEWVDGHWWYGRKTNGHDWWRIRYW